MPQPPAYRWQLLRAGPLWLDGGGMFGVIPRVVWNRSVPCDEQGRIEVAHNCLLLERVGNAADSPRRVLIETGSGDKADSKMRKIFGLTDFSIADAVAAAGVPCEEIEQVIVSHLHFDHAGGLTCLSREGQAADWVGPTGFGDILQGVTRTFPNAPITVQRTEWEDAIANRSTMTRTYLRDHLEPIRPHLRLIDSSAPFPSGHRPERDEEPPLPLRERETEVLPGIFVFRVPGHTWGQQAIRFTDDLGRTVVFTPDVLPTVHHVGAAYNLAYDQEPYISTVTRHWFLAAAVREDWLLVLDHEPGNPVVRVRADGKGWFGLKPDSA